MKIMMMVLAMSLSMSTFAAGALRCELTENGAVIAGGQSPVDENGEAFVDLGSHDQYAFAGMIWDGYPATIIMSADGDKKSNETSDSVISSTGTTLTITCTL